MAANSTVFNSLATATVQPGGPTPSNQGLVVSTQTNVVNFGANNSTTSLFTIPAGSQILFIHIDVTTAFNAGTTNTIEIGTSSSAAQFVSPTSVASAGRESIATTGNYANWTNVGTSDVTLVATYNQTGTAATAGSAQVTVIYAF